MLEGTVIGHEVLHFRGGKLMAYAELLEEVKGLNESDMAEVVDFVRFLKTKYISKTSHRESNMLKGKLNYMSEDFDDSLDEFKE